MTAISEPLRKQAAFCEAMGTRLYGALMRYAADDYDTGGAVRTFYDAHPPLRQYSHPGLRLFSALHRFALEGTAPALARHFPSCGGDGDAEAAWAAARDLVRDRAGEIAEAYVQTPQTNETARSTVLLAALLAVAATFELPIHLYEVAASAGLNSRLDCYRYEVDGWSWGPAHSPLVLRNRVRSGKPRHLDAPLKITQRRACDLDPRDAADEHDRTVLASFLWPDQVQRFERFSAAVKAAARIPLTVERADMIEWIDALQPVAGAVSVLMHSVVTEHLPTSAREAFEGATHAFLKRASQDAPAAWVRMEFAGKDYETRVTVAPQQRELLVARTDGHAQDIVWQ